MRTETFVPDGSPEDSYTVTVSPVSMRAFFAFIDEWSKDSTVPEFMAQLTTFTALAQPTKNGEPLGDAFLDEDFALSRGLVNFWITSVREVPPPLPLGSSGTTPSGAAQTRHPNSPGRRRSTRS